MNRKLNFSVQIILLASIFSFVVPLQLSGQEPFAEKVSAWLAQLPSLDPAAAQGPMVSQSLTKEQAIEAQGRVWAEYVKRNTERFEKQIESKAIESGGLTLKWLERRFSPEGAEEMPLFISMHGGGGAPAQVNDQQWNNQIRLYEPTEGIVVAPRAPGNTWDLWHQGHIDPLFDQLILAYVATQGVDPNRVYLMGYSAGGDGVYQVAPRMADRFAAASMMAGHPNESQPDGLRNLPFSIFMGGKDDAYNRNRIAAEWGKKLDDLQTEDPKGYIHQVKIYPDKAHWMGGNDRESLPWMLQYHRKLAVDRIVWRQDDVTHSSFYWLEIQSDEPIPAGTKIVANVHGNAIDVQTDFAKPLVVHLSDALVDLDQPVQCSLNGKKVFDAKVHRTLASMLQNLAKTPDPKRLWSAEVEVK